MMRDPFQLLREIVGGSLSVPPSGGASGGSGGDGDPEFTEACHVRLLQALRSAGGTGSPGSPDLAGLVRHVLRREEETQSGASQTIRAPNRAPWPDRRVWQECGVEVINEGPGGFLLRARKWAPDWLPQAGDCPPEAAAFAEAPRRNYQPVAADPFVGIAGFDSYRSSGQRDAMRAVMTAPPGSTLVINLPTGAGKSLCAHLPALHLSRDYGVSVVVVPTTALAIDQERAVSRHVPHLTAYYQDQSPGGRERREKIRERIRDGTQRIVFTSPESVMESLAPALYAAAERGFMRTLVVDEAHMVEQWGDEFRPSFQELPGLRKDLLRVARGEPFVTVLMTGTLTEYCLDTLETLYGSPGPFDVISAAQLRPEPSYWAAYCRDEEERGRRVLEAVCNLPRPLILYATKVREVEGWGDELRRFGFRRLAVVTGASSAEHRGRVIDQWRERHLDIIVATSAFGLGVDQSDVRAVVHACIPETIDRFYQEVGRGGRDGKASVSLLLYTKADFATAGGLNKKVTISAKRGLQRWRRMFGAKEVLPDGRIKVPVDISPGMGQGDIDMVNLRNRGWNVRTLTLMSRAGLIEMDAEPPPQQPAEGDGADAEAASAAYLEELRDRHNARVIRILDDGHMREDVWAERVEPVRETRASLSRRSLDLMIEALKGKQDIARLLTEAYSITARENPPRNGAAVSHACGGCAACRAGNVSPYAAALPPSVPAWRAVDFAVGEELRRLIGGAGNCLAVYCDARGRGADWEGQLGNLVRWFAAQKVANVVDPAGALSNVRSELSRGRDGVVFFHERFDPLRIPPVPTLVIHPAGELVPPAYLNFAKGKVARVLLLPEDAADPRRRDRRLADVLDCRSFRFEELLTLLAI